MKKNTIANGNNTVMETMSVLTIVSNAVQAFRYINQYLGQCLFNWTSIQLDIANIL